MPLPPAPTAFRWIREVWGHALSAVALEPHAQHLFTTRQLQLHAGDMNTAWDLAAASAGGDSDRLFRIKQVHGRSVRVVRSADDTADGRHARPEADAIISNVQGAVLAVQVADCVPMLLCDPVTRAAGAVHAGWRGTAAGVGRETVQAFAREFGTRPEDLQVAMGPSIGACCYEVGDELIEAFRVSGASAEQLARWFSRPNGDGRAARPRLDLWAANQEQLIAAGVRADHIYISRLCTQTHADVFDSYRVAGPRAGRMIAAIRVPHV